MKKILSILILSVLICAKNSYAVNIATIGLDASLINTYIAEDESGNTEVKKAIDNFVFNFITPNMSDFEKEIQIIKYLVATVTYDTDVYNNEFLGLTDTYKAYGALVNHKAVCSGYAKAFDLLCKYSGLSTTVVTGTATNSAGKTEAHAWNQIYLDGEWYNVDVTWEDSVTNLSLGFDNLLNEYINRTDLEFSKDHVKDNGNVCTATKYGKEVVSYYLTTGIVDFNANVDNVRNIFINQIDVLSSENKTEEVNAIIDKLLMIGVKYNDNSNYIASGMDMDVTNYILTELVKGKRVITIVTGPGTANKYSIDSGHFIEDYVTIQGRISLQRFYATDGKTDTRILIFKFG